MRCVRIVFFLLFFLVLIELYLRLYWGFCDAVLMVEDPNFEYIASPNQNRYRFRKHIKYNSFSMRSDEPDSAKLKVLMFGDSVINGGVLTSQDSLSSTLLSSFTFPIVKRNFQFLNISAGSWGPDNCYAYLSHFGDFDAELIILVVSSHDAYDNMAFEKIVGVNPSFPTKQYSLAILELVDRYFLPLIQFRRSTFIEINKDLGINKKDSLSIFNTGFADFYHYCKSKNIPFILYLHAERSEVDANSYNEQGKEIIRFAQQYQIPLIKDLEMSIGLPDYRDNIHLNERGQRRMADNIYRALVQFQKKELLFPKVQ